MLKWTWINGKLISERSQLKSPSIERLTLRQQKDWSKTGRDYKGLSYVLVYVHGEVKKVLNNRSLTQDGVPDNVAAALDAPTAAAQLADLRVHR